jgi:hypothetical protein
MVATADIEFEVLATVRLPPLRIGFAYPRPEFAEGVEIGTGRDSFDFAEVRSADDDPANLCSGPPDPRSARRGREES